MSGIEQYMRDKEGRPRLILLGLILIGACSILFLMEHWKPEDEKSYLYGLVPLETFALVASTIGVAAIVAGVIKKLRR